MKALALLLLLVMFAGCSSTRSIESRIFPLKDNLVTPQGVRVRMEQGVTVSTTELIAIDKGIAVTLAKAKCRYGRSNRHTDYIVAVIKGELYNGNPVYRLPCGQYCGTVYDKGGFIYASGQMLTVGQPYGNIIVIPEQYQNFDNTATISEYEAEHVELAYLDGDEFERTKTHGDGVGHPILNCGGIK